jgi:hypothetical protein
MTVTDEIRVRFVGYRRIVEFSGKDFVEKPAGIPGWERQNSEAKVKNLHRATVVEIPTMTNRCGQGHLSRRRYVERLRVGHVSPIGKVRIIPSVREKAAPG